LIFKQLSPFENPKVENYLPHFTKIIKPNPEIEILSQQVYDIYSATVNPSVVYNPDSINTGIVNAFS
jgi:hypothetical protein